MTDRTVAGDRPSRKEGFSALDTLALVREIRALGKAWFDKAYDLPGEGLLVSFRVQGQGRFDLTLAPGRHAFLRPAAEERPDAPGRLGSEVRRQLTGAPLLAVLQPEGERYVEMTFGRGGEESPALLAVELFGAGNIVVVRRERIGALLHAKVWAGRKLRTGEPYVRPPSRKDPFHLSEGELLALLSRSKTDLVSTLAARLGLGGPLAEEVVARSGVEGRQPASLAAAATEGPKILAALSSVLSDMADPPRGFLVRDRESGRPLDATPYPSRRWQGREGVEEVQVERFSDAAAIFFTERPKDEPPPPTSHQAQRTSRREELERLRAQQLAAVESLTGAMAADRAAAELLLSHYEEAQRAVESARAATPEGEEVVEVEVQVAGRPFRLAAWRPLRESAQALFEEAKRKLPKLEGAQRALTDTQAKLAELEREQARESRAAEARQVRTLPGEGADGPPHPWRLPRKKHFWFEKAPRWMVSSEGRVAVSGRDARSNDAIVKRYLRERDIYSHADLQGAPSVVVKHPPPGQGDVGEATLREVCHWGVCNSKAWHAGLASADAFWVTGDSVSKAGASGEYVARGSWVIHGTKHYVRDLPLELVLGTVEYEGETLLQVGPRASFEGAGARRLWVLSPGNDKERDAVERQVAQDLGISRERVQALFPPGGVKAQRA